jgi:hypothetical protein
MDDLEPGHRPANDAAGHAVPKVFRVEQLVEPDQRAIRRRIHIAPRGMEHPRRLPAFEVFAAPFAEGVALPQLAAVGADVHAVRRHLVEVAHARVGRVVVPAVDERVHLLHEDRVGGGVRESGEEQAAREEERFHA